MPVVGKCHLRRCWRRSPATPQNSWKSPDFSKGIDWRTKKNAKEICETVTSRLPTKEKLREHFHNDVRIAWAVSVGQVFPNRKKKPVAPPGSFDAFLARIDAWIDAGFPCPK